MTFLLGAGASVEAGLPASSALTQKMAQLIDRSRDSDLSRAINAAIGAMVAHDTAKGRSAYEQVDIERLFSAVEMLANLDDQELAPFVTAWSPSISFVGGVPEFPHRWVHEFAHTLSEAAKDYSRFDERNFEEAFAKGVRSVGGGEYGSQVFKKLQRQMLFQLVELLRIDPARIEYLSPLLNIEPPIRVATLNYDTAIEDLAWRAERSCTTGLESWEAGAGWSWPAADIHLLKLHGSLTWNWHLERPTDKLWEVKTTEIQPDANGRWFFPNSYYERGVVFGRRGKLRVDGPYLAMLQAFEAFLEETSCLVIIGYSLRDDHINSAIGRWFNRDHKRVVWIDPYLPPFRPDGETFANALLRQLHVPAVEESRRTSALMRLESSWAPAEGHQILRKSTGEALSALLGTGPSLTRLQQP